MPAPHTLAPGEEIQELRFHLEQKMNRSVELAVRRKVKQVVAMNPEWAQHSHRLSKLNEKIHRNRLRQAKQALSRKIYIRKAWKARATHRRLVTDDAMLTRMRAEVQETMATIEKAQRQEIEERAAARPAEETLVRASL